MRWLNVKMSKVRVFNSHPLFNWFYLIRCIRIPNNHFCPTTQLMYHTNTIKSGAAYFNTPAIIHLDRLTPLLSVTLTDRWWGSMRELWSSDWVTCCVEDPKDQVVTDYCNPSRSSVSGDLKTVLLHYSSYVLFLGCVKTVVVTGMCENDCLGGL